MHSTDKKLITTAIVLAFSTIGALCCLVLIAKLPGWGDKKPEWIGALGTIAAFAGTIWIATSETRRRHREELTRARLRAAGMLMHITFVQQVVGELREDLRLAITVDKSPDEILGYGEKLKGLDLWTLDEIETLIPLPHNTAALLAQSAGEIEIMKKMFDRASEENTLDIWEQRHSFVRFYYDSLGATYENLSMCSVDCVRARELLVRPSLDRFLY